MKLDERPEPGGNNGCGLAVEAGFAAAGASVMTLSTSCQPTGAAHLTSCWKDWQRLQRVRHLGRIHILSINYEEKHVEYSAKST